MDGRFGGRFNGRLIVGSALVVLAGCQSAVLVPAPPMPEPDPTDRIAATRLVELSGPERHDALTAIAALTVRGRGPKTGYLRAMFGDAWSDDATGVLWSGNSCSTRDDVLARDLDAAVKRDRCVVVSGRYQDPYSGRTIEFTKAGAASSPIDHVIALSFAWQMGASGWTGPQRLRFANDPLNLVTTTKAVNTSKGDADPASWLPPNKAVRCAYVRRYALVALKYQLPVTTSDKQIMADQCVPR